jgi:hypothetical protein
MLVVNYADHLRLTLSGDLISRETGGPVIEGFSVRLNASNPAGVSGNWMDGEVFPDVVADCVAFWGRPTSFIAGQCVLREVKVARIGNLGKYVGDAKIAAVNQPGAGGVLPYPPQISIAVSLDTGQRGASKRGRIFLPGPTMGMELDHSINGSAVTSLRDSVATWINALNNAPGFDANSPRVTIASSKGFNTDVTSVRVGRVFDTQRRRRRSLQERYSLSTAIT